MAGSVKSEDGEIGFQIAPMVDVVFVLMLFFLACAGMRVKEHELNILLPSQHTGGGETVALIEISPEGQVVANGQTFGAPTDKALNHFRDWLKVVRSFGGEDPIVIRPAPTARHERIMDVLNACRVAGVEKITFAP